MPASKKDTNCDQENSGKGGCQRQGQNLFLSKKYQMTPTCRQRWKTWKMHRVSSRAGRAVQGTDSFFMTVRLGSRSSTRGIKKQEEKDKKAEEEKKKKEERDRAAEEEEWDQWEDPQWLEEEWYGSNSGF